MPPPACFGAFSSLLLALALAPALAGPAGAASCWPGAPGSDPALCPPDDPEYAAHWEYGSGIPEGVDARRMHPAERALGSIGISLDRAWQHTVGRDDVVIAVLDSGILWDHADLRKKLYLNPGELPRPRGAARHDRNGDGVFDVDDYAGDPRVGDRNKNGVLDAGDLVRAFSDCKDDDGNGYADDISGYDVFAGRHCGVEGGDNDPADDTRFGHGTGIASTAAAQTDNGIGDVGVCPRCRILPVRVGDSFVVDANRFARGVVFAVRAGASVIASALGSYNNTPAARRAVDLAYAAGVPLIASAADEYSYHHNYPSLYGHAFYVNAIRFNHVDEFRKADTFWGLSPCTNFGARVSLAVPATSCSSGATARLAGVAGLVVSAARDAGAGPLAAEEVYQVLRGTADDLDTSSPDWGATRYPGLPGFDQLTGYGRVNALSAVRDARQGRIPPLADLAGPDWFEIVSPVATPRVPVTGAIRVPRAQAGTWDVAYALGVEPPEDAFTRLAGGEVRGTLEGTLAVLDFGTLPVPAGPSPAGRDDRDRYSVTVRLRVTDDRGLVAESRRSFFVLHDPLWKAGFPRSVGASGESGPLLADLDGDGRDEIVLATADGTIRILAWTGSGLRERRLLLDPGLPLGPAGAGDRPRETVIREPAVGDVLGSGEPAIVAASREGKVYAFRPDGRRLPGFPVSVPPGSALRPALKEVLESGILSRPVLADLDGAPGLEIVASALDGKLYAWRGNGRPLPGFPVPLRDPRTGRLSKLVSTPAVGDLDGDGRPEIVVGSNGLEKGQGAAYAVRGNGTRHPGGPFVPGWSPVELALLRGDLLPTVATGVQMTPALVDADGDGDLEVVLYGVTGTGIVLLDHRPGGPPAVIARYAMEPGAGSELQGTSFLGSPGSPLLADADGDGGPELYAPLLPLRMLTLRTHPGVPLDVPPAIGGWDLRGDGPSASSPVPMLATWPRRMEDLTILAAPAAVDVDGDGRAEILAGSGGYLLHAFRRDGGEAPGFPKFTGGWIFSEPAVGDLDGDGERELVTVTREGSLFAWRLPPPAPPLEAEARPGR